LIALLGMKFDPASQGFCRYHSFARSAGHRPAISTAAALTDAPAINKTTAPNVTRDFISGKCTPDDRHCEQRAARPRHGDAS
jgi:hypothetical protein